MKTKYIDLITQSFDFPQDEFEMDGEYLKFNGIDLKALVEEHGTPLKFTYLPKISQNIQKESSTPNQAVLLYQDSPKDP